MVPWTPENADEMVRGAARIDEMSGEQRERLYGLADRFRAHIEQEVMMVSSGGNVPVMRPAGAEPVRQVLAMTVELVDMLEHATSDLVLALNGPTTASEKEPPLVAGQGVAGMASELRARVSRVLTVVKEQAERL